MTLVVEDGTGLSTAESYLSAVDLLTAALKQGLGYLNPDDQTQAWLNDLLDGDDYDGVEAALRRGTVYLEGRYFDCWRGFCTYPAQALSWPRAGVLRPRAGAGLGGVGFYSAGLLRTAYGVPGQPSFGRGGSAWGGGYGAAGYGRQQHYPSDAVPACVLLACTHAALREYVAPGSLLPDFVAAQMVQSESVGPVLTSYFNFGPTGNAPTLPQIDDCLRPVLISGGGASTPLARG